MSPTTSNETLFPRVGCGAAILREGRLLLVERVRQPESGHWGLPGGKVDWLEPVPIAVAREVREELGIVITPRTLLCVVDHIDAANAQHWVAPVYLVEHYEGEPTIREPHVLSRWGWFPLTELPQPLTRATQVAVAELARRSLAQL